MAVRLGRLALRKLKGYSTGFFDSAWNVAIEFRLPCRVQMPVGGQTVLTRSKKGMKTNRRVGK